MKIKKIAIAILAIVLCFGMAGNTLAQTAQLSTNGSAYGKSDIQAEGDTTDIANANPVSAAVEESEDYDLRILFVGNSFTNYNNLNKIFRSITESFGMHIKSERLSSDGYYLNQFASLNDSYGRVLESRLTTHDDFDVIVLQEYSTNAYKDFDDFFASVSTICEKINVTQKDARIYLYQTWAYEDAARAEGWTLPAMEARIGIAYNAAANRLGIGVCPVGKAFTTTFFEHPEIRLLATDRKHPSYAGSYLAACVDVAAILDLDVRRTDFIGELDEETAETLQSIAYDVVQEVREVSRAKREGRMPHPVRPVLRVSWEADSDTRYQDLYTFVADGAEQQPAILATALRPLKNVRILSLTLLEIDEEGRATYQAQERYRIEELTPDKPLQLHLIFEGLLPNNGIAFDDIFGRTHYFAINESGKDGALLMDEINVVNDSLAAKVPD